MEGDGAFRFWDRVIRADMEEEGIYGKRRCGKKGDENFVWVGTKKNGIFQTGKTFPS